MTSIILKEILDRAAVIWEKEEFTDDHDPFDAISAWGQAVKEILQNDTDALAFVAGVIGDPELAHVRWGDDLGGDDQSFVEFVKGSLYSRDEFVNLLKAQIPNYDDELAKRKQKANAYHLAES